MIDYFVGTEADLLRRGRSLLGKIPSKLPREFHLLAQRCRDDLAKDLDDLQTLGKLPPNARLRKLKRIVAHIDFLEVNGFAALNRANDDDKNVNILIGRIVEEINYPLLPPVVTLLSQSYFSIWPTLGLLRVPLGEVDSLLHLPDLYHELAHPFVDDQYDPRVQPFRDALGRGLSVVEAYIAGELERESRSRGPRTLSLYLTTWLESWTESWLEELFCDLFATITLGPAFVWAHLHLCTKRGLNPYDVPLHVPTTHPADDAQMTIMLTALRCIGFSDDADQIAARWHELVEISNYHPDAEFQRCYPLSLLESLSQVTYKGVAAMGCRIAHPETSDLVHDTLNGAWKEFWRAPAAYPVWEEAAVSRLRGKLTTD